MIGFHFLFYNGNLLSEEIKKSKTVEVIGVSQEGEVGKTKSVKSDPTGFTEVIDAEKFRGKYTSLTDVLEREAGVRVRRFGGLCGRVSQWRRINVVRTRPLTAEMPDR